LQFTDDFTVCSNIRTDNAATTINVISKDYSTGSSRGWLMSVDGSSGSFVVEVYMDAAGTTYKKYESSVTVNDDSWHQIAFTFDAGVLKLYVDGSEDASVTKVQDDVVSSVNNSTQALLIGSLRTGLSSYVGFDGRVDQTTVWSQALTESEINEIYRNGCPGDLSTHSQYANLNAWWKMGDGDTHPTISDNKNSNDGTMLNMSAASFVEDSPCRE